MPDIKLVLTDMDGTIVMPGKHEISERVRQAVIACEDAGVTVAAVTGRPIEFAQDALSLLGFDDVSIFDGGASIRNVKSGELVWSQWLEPDVLRQVVTVLLPYAREIIDYDPVMTNRRPEATRLEDITEPAPYVFTAVLNEDVAAVEALLAGVPGIAAHSNPAWESSPTLTGIQVTHQAADKQHGVATLLAIKNVTSDQVLAIGDSNNDVPLFRNAGIKVAMGNATQRLKDAADHVVAPVEADGFAEAMERFVLR